MLRTAFGRLENKPWTLKLVCEETVDESMQVVPAEGVVSLGFRLIPDTTVYGDCFLSALLSDAHRGAASVET